jgi:Ca-activated chloride channel family protein
MKKLISVIIVFILVTMGALTGCTKNDSKESSTTDSQNTEAGSGKETKDEAAPEGSAADTSVQSTAEEAPATEYEMDSSPAKEEGAPTFTEESNSSISDDVSYKYIDMGQPVVPDTEEFTEITENGFKETFNNPLSTFSIDVDTASYTNLRKDINYGILPEQDSIRIEEMLNYFTYDYKEPVDGKPFSINTEIGKCPWNEEHYLLTVGIQGKNVDVKSLPKSNLVFLIDVSGSMDEPDKLPLLKNAFSQLIEMLGEDDKVSIVVYAGSSGVVLDGVRGNEKRILLNAIENLSAGGSTGGAEGIERAYQLAKENFIPKGNNRVILATDGDFNVGPASVGELEAIIEEKRDDNIFLSVIGFGSGNLKDNKMEVLADKGNGNYSYIDTPREAKKVLVDEMSGTLLTIAKDVKIQLEFNPSSVEAYRLIGYENRALQNEDFKDDTVDAGELGAGHSVTAVYEITPTRASGTKDLKYQSEESVIKEEYRNEITEVRLRYKEPDGVESKEILQVVSFDNTPVNGKKNSADYYFAAAVVQFGMICRDSEYKGNATIDSVLEFAEKGLGEDAGQYRREFMSLVEQYDKLDYYGW